MTTIPVPFTVSFTVGDADISQAIEGDILVMLSDDDPSEDECGGWRFHKPVESKFYCGLTHRITDQLERTAMVQAREMHADELDQAKANRALAREESR